MNRRKFLTTMIGGLAAGTAVRTFPFRVFSFPSDIKVVINYPKATLLTALNDRMFSIGDLVSIPIYSGDMKDSEVLRVVSLISGTLTVEREPF